MLTRLVMPFVILALCIIVHAFMMTILLGRSRHAVGGARMRFWPVSWLLIRLGLWIVAAHLIEIAIWAAVGGRGTLIGPIIGAFVVNLAKSWFTVSFPEYWLFFLGLLFIVVTLLLPKGLVGLWQTLRARKSAQGAK